MSYIRERYEKLFPETTWSDEKIVANMFRCNKIAETKNDKAKLEDKIFDTDEELYEYFQHLYAIPLDTIICELTAKI